MSPQSKGDARETQVLMIAIVACLLSLGVHGGIQAALGRSLNKQLAAQRQTELEAHQAAEQEAEAAFQKAQAEAETVVAEGRAAAAREEEYYRRLGMDPAFAKSAAEKRLLEMKALAEQADLEPQARLEKLAKLAAPKGTGIQVDAVKGGFNVQLAVSTAKLEPDAAIGREDRDYLYRATRQAAAGILRDLFAFGSDSGLLEAEVSCMNLSQVSGREGVRQEYIELYRASLTPKNPSNREWQGKTRTDAAQAMKVSLDEFARISYRK